jgi:hypothetical protein
VETCLDRPRQARRALRRFEREVLRGIEAFSWYIYRATRPALRNMFMSPRNILGIESALLSLLAGDVFHRSSLRLRLLVFKAIYYISSALTPKRTVQSWLEQWRNLPAE